MRCHSTFQKEASYLTTRHLRMGVLSFNAGSDHDSYLRRSLTTRSLVCTRRHGPPFLPTHKQNGGTGGCTPSVLIALYGTHNAINIRAGSGSVFIGPLY